MEGLMCSKSEEDMLELSTPYAFVLPHAENRLELGYSVEVEPYK